MEKERRKRERLSTFYMENQASTRHPPSRPRGRYDAHEAPSPCQARIRTITVFRGPGVVSGGASGVLAPAIHPDRLQHEAMARSGTRGKPSDDQLSPRFPTRFAFNLCIARGLGSMVSSWITGSDFPSVFQSLHLRYAQGTPEIPTYADTLVLFPG